MTPTPTLQHFDHVHVFVADRARAVDWYQRVMGLAPVAALASWAVDGGPLTLGNASGSIHLALFERPAQPCRSTIALAVGAAEFHAWRTHLTGALGRDVAVEDHTLSWSLYFTDPDGNPYEITCYDIAALRAQPPTG